MKRITGALALYVLGFVAACTIAISCNHTDCKTSPNDPACVATATVSDCTGGSVDGAIAKYGPQIEQLIAQTPRKPDGSVDWSAIESKIEQNVAQAGMCVIADVFSKYVFKTTPFTGQGTPPPAPDDAKAEFDKLRAAHAPGVTFKTKNGTL